MLDPISAVGVAAATVQFAHFTAKLFAIGKEVHDSKGTTQELVHLDEVYSHLEKISSSLSQSLARTGTISREEQDICRLATSCQQECVLFTAAIDKIGKKSGSNRVFTDFQQALKIVWNQKAIVALEKRMMRFQTELSLALIIHMGNSQATIVRGLQSLIADTQRLESSQKHQVDGITSLLREIQKRQKIPSNQRLKVNDPSIPEEFKNVTSRLPWAFQVASEMIVHQKILRSLYFESLKIRHARIQNAHERTFRWLYQENRKDLSVNDNRVRFVNWLRSGDGIFWISGKPGSGKSTLMKWIADNKTTKDVLSEWARSGVVQNFSEEVPVVTASFYFWSAGTTMQKSQQGLFQSLLYEIFRHSPDLMKKACPTRWQVAESGEHQEPWSMIEISETIHRTVSIAGRSTRFCFFVDGIDEYNGDHFEMVETLEGLSQLPNVKLCVASRPWNVFEDTFGRCTQQKFYLQDLTRGDIDRYVQSKLMQHPTWKSLANGDIHYDAVGKEVVERAQGVFLWVFLVVKSLLEGLSNGDTASLLHQRVRRIPSDLREFFKFILDSLDPIYNQHVAHFFLAALESSESLPLMAYSYFEDEYDNSDYVLELDTAALHKSEMLSRLKQTSRRLNGRCKGLLEVYGESDEDERRDTDQDNPFYYQVGFLHRTVRDFFMTEEMRREFESRLPGSLQICLSMVKANIAMIKKMPRTDEWVQSSSFQALVDTTLNSSRKAEVLNGVPITALMEDLYYALTKARFFGSYTFNGIHWKDDFLGLTIERGLTLYASQQLQYPASGPIVKRQLRLKEHNYPILFRAMSTLQIPATGEPDVCSMVLYLLEKGCNPNETCEQDLHMQEMSSYRSNYYTLHLKQMAFSYENQTPFSYLLSSVGFEGTNQEPIAQKSVYAGRIRLLKHLLTHGADPHHYLGNTHWPLFMFILDRLFQKDSPEKLSWYYLEIIELLASWGMNVNTPLRDSCCCGAPTPWIHFIKLLNSRTYINHPRGELLARVCAILLKHGADPTPERKYYDMKLPSVEHVFQFTFSRRVARPLITALHAVADTEASKLTSSPRFPWSLWSWWWN
ncbi:hypothetical protein K505DRAFT_313725 [Melanomma pulvis-pyrius CBS 109.77]|uniref:Uncharacterized protein n=1 Tax=Melanomma pulvis-pyrius CBS 109.77 TaxID=1314802 RepID=A0A6A6WYD5_9PLEO|nr:hypothetical protein K505DRAFT_313725 [Melanomma pulvis-pyrius CBS 109.77]